MSLIITNSGIPRVMELPGTLHLKFVFYMCFFHSNSMAHSMLTLLTGPSLSEWSRLEAGLAKTNVLDLLVAF